MTMTDQLKDFSMKLRRAFSIMMLLSVSFISLADDFDNEFNGMNSTMDELDMETGSCIPELKAQTQRATKMLALLSKKKSKIAALEGKVDNLTSKLIARSEVKACDTSKLTQQIANLQASNALLKSENGRLTSSVLTLQNVQTNASANQTTLLLAQRENSRLKSENERLKSELILGKRRGSPTIPSTKAPIIVSGIDYETVDADWDWTAIKFGNYIDQNFAYSCPPKGTIGKVWGTTDNYMIDSRVCSAAVHAGLITMESGGTAIIKITKFKKKYKQSFHHGVGTKPHSGQRYGAAINGFVFLAPPARTEVAVPAEGGGVKLLKVAKVNASSDRGRKYRAFNVNDGNPATVWQSENNVTSAQSIKLSLDRNEVVSRLYISIPEYKYGYPPKSVTLFFSDGSSQVFPMAEKWGKQRFSFNPIKTSSIEVEIGGMHKRSPHGTYSFLQISEIELYGQ